MKLSAILEDDKNIVMIPLIWLKLEDRQYFIQKGYEVIPISGYRETDGFRACKIIGKYSDNSWSIKEYSIPILEDWKLTAQYASYAEKSDSTTGIQMFNHLDDDEKIRALKFGWWWDPTPEYIKKYFKDHPDLQKHADIL